MKPHRRLLAESQHFRLEHEWEQVFVVDKVAESEADAGDHYGDPTRGLITADETWFITGGEGLVCYHVSGEMLEFFRSNKEPFLQAAPGVGRTPAWFVHDLRLEGPESLLVLLDPWSDYASVWRVNLRRRVLTKLRDGPFLEGHPYAEDVPF